jgi:hypothetical protein
MLWAVIAAYKDESKRRCYRIKYLAEANRNRHAGIDTSGYDYL